MFIGEWNKSVIITYIGTIFAVIGIFMVFEGKVSEAYGALIIAGVCDMLDGTIARKCKRNESQKLFGIQIDSLADVIGFVVFPVILACGSGLNRWYHIPVMCLFCICGIARLAYFNMNCGGEEGPCKYYHGLPVTFTAIILPLVYPLHLVMKEAVFGIMYTLLFIVIAFFNILNIKVIKPKGAACGILCFLALIMVIVYWCIL